MHLTNTLSGLDMQTLLPVTSSVRCTAAIIEEFEEICHLHDSLNGRSSNI